MLLVWVILAIGLYIAIPILLSFQSSRIFFGLKCPKCGAVKGRAASFLFTRRRCAACRHEWVQRR